MGRFLLALLISFFVPSLAYAEEEKNIQELIKRARHTELFGSLLIWKPGSPSLNITQGNASWANKKVFCSDGSVGIFWNSSHPGGNPDERHQERNRGLFFDCPISNYWNGLVQTKFKVGGVLNSKDDNAYLAGLGVRIETPEFYYLTLGAGGEIHYIRYENSRKNLVIDGLVPIATLELGVRIPGWCRYQVIQHRLADTGVKLYAKKFECEYQF